MINSRSWAGFVTLLLILVIAAAAIFAVATIGPALAHDSNALHAHGKLLTFNAVTSDLVMQKDDKQVIHLQCAQRCLLQKGHISRHINEKAPTDVYYMQSANAMLIALDVD